MTEELAGWVQKVVYQNGDFYIFRLLSELRDSFTVRGHAYGLLQVQPGIPLRLLGSWKRHPKYGPQFTAHSWEPWARRSDDVELFLHTCIPGFADRGLAAKIATIGTSAYETLSKGYDALADKLGAVDAPEALHGAVLGWQGALSLRDLSEMLRDGGLGSVDIQLAMSRFGTEAASIIRENPYRLMEVLWDFPRVDRLALKLGFKLDNPHRTAGAILWALRDETREGHLYLQRGEIPGALDRLVRQNTVMALSESCLDTALEELTSTKTLVLEPGTGVYLPQYYEYERKSAALLAELLAPSEIKVDLEPFLLDYEKGNRIQLSKDQRNAVETLTQHRVMVLTGLPGTGKTTAVRVLVRLFEEARLTFSLMAPTGIAAKRLSAVTGKAASTIHRALGYDGENWRRNEDNRYIVDAVIVDEMSMVDQELFYRLLSALRPGTMLVLVGDDAQLPSVGPGNVLRELVTSAVPHVRLTQIFRQSSKGEIVINSHRINRGEMPSLVGAREESEMKFVRLADEDRLVGLIVGMAEKLKSRNANFQVLSPKYDGTVGVNHLNEMLRDRLNPSGPREWVQGNVRFRLGDRLMVTQNDYKLGVYNGDMGKLSGINGDSLTVRIHGISPDDPDTLVDFPFETAVEKLKLAYAISVHKSQGSEFDTVILPVTRSQGRMLQRNLLYTAVTRARKQVWLLGEEDAVRKAVSNNLVIRRNTAFASALGVEIAHGRRPTPKAEETSGEPTS